MKKEFFTFLCTLFLATSCNFNQGKQKKEDVQTLSTEDISSQISTSINSETNPQNTSNLENTSEQIEHHHSWTSVSYTWNADYSECTAERTCIIPPIHYEKETVQSTYVVINQPTCDTSGFGIYTATFTNPIFVKQQQINVIQPNGHNFDEPTYIWNEDYTQCTAQRICLTDNSHIETETVNSVIVQINAPQCETGGVNAQKATFTNAGFSTQFHYFNTEMTGHDFGNVTYTWSNNYSSCTAKRVCKNDSSHVEEETVECDVEIITALDCEVDGQEIHSASFVNPVFETQYHQVIINHTGHNFGEPTYSWNFDHSQCTAERVCLNNASHVERETAHSSSEIISESSYYNTGIREYTVEFSNPHFTKQIFDENIPLVEYLTYQLSNSGNYYIVTGVVSDFNGFVTIPSTFNDLPVKEIGASAFRNADIIGVNIPGSINTIGNDAFYYCEKLEQVNFSEGLLYIGSYAFYHCELLKSIILPSSVQTIQNLAFYGATLTNLVLSEGLTSVLQYAFYLNVEELIIPSSLQDFRYVFNGTIKNLVIPNNFTKSNIDSISYTCSINSITIQDDNPNFFFENGVLFEKNTNNVVFVSKSLSGEFVIPSFMTNIPDHFLDSCSNISSIVFHENIESIGNYAFANCDSLTQVHLPDSVKTLGTNIFYDCRDLQSVQLPNTISIIPEYMFGYCQSLTDIIIPNTVATIGSRAFYDCQNLTSINLLNIINLGSSVFSYCYSLESVAFGDELTVVPDHTFYACYKLNNIVLPNNITTIGESAFAGCSSLKQITLPESLESIKYHAFSGSGVTSIFIPENVSEINNLGLNSQAAISVAAENANFVAVNNAIYSKNMERIVYANPSGISFEIIEGVKTIGRYCIESELKSIVLPSSLISIEDYGFNGRYLETIEFPEQLQTIGYGIFGDNYQIKEIIFPKDLVSIGYYNDFRGLDHVVLSDHMNYQYLSNLLERHKIFDVEIYPTNPYLEMDSGILYTESFDTIVWASPNLSGSITISNTVETIENNAFEKCDKITALYIPNSVLYIWNYAFRNCSSLKEIVLPEQLDRYYYLFNKSPIETITLPNNVPFYDLWGGNYDNMYMSESYLGYFYPKTLKNVIVRDSHLFYTKRGKAIWSGDEDEEALIFIERDFSGNFIIPETTREIRQFAFTDCFGLTSVELGSNLQTISYKAFYNCINLETVAFNNVLSELSGGVFANCDSLTDVQLPNSIWYCYDDIFVDCDNLVSVKVPDSIDLSETYNWSRKLENIELYDTNTRYKNINGLIYTFDLKNLVFIPASTTNIVLPQEVTSFPTSALYGHNDIDITITNPNIKIGQDYLGNYVPSNVKSLTIPDSMNILNDAGTEIRFSISDLERMNISNTNLYVTQIDGAIYTNDMKTLLFVPRNWEGNFVIPQSVETIGDSAFSNCTKITSVEFSNGLKTIGSGAFEGCSSLISASLPSSLKDIEGRAFKDCTSLSHIYIPDLTISYIDFNTFQNCTSLVEFNIPVGALYIRERAFDGCNSLATIAFPEVFHGIEQGAFFNCTSLHEIVLPDGTQTLDAGAFIGCASLEEIYIPSTINDIIIPFLANELVITYGGTYEEWLSHVDYHEFIDERDSAIIMEIIGYMPNNNFILRCSDGSYSYNYASNTYTPL